MDSPKKIVVVGGGAAGFFGAITCAEANPALEVTLLEKSPQFLGKVRISGGGRCNVTHACFDPRELTTRFPRGERALIGAFQRFQATDTVSWFAERGVVLKTEADGRMFPTTDTSQTIIDCLIQTSQKAGVKLFTGRGVDKITHGGNVFQLHLGNGETIEADAVLLATGGCRTPALAQVAVSLGHTLEPPVPSLFTFHVETAWLRGLAGVSVPKVVASVPGTTLKEEGPILITHWGLSGPVILRLSAWGARLLHQRNYQFDLLIDWVPALAPEDLLVEFHKRRQIEGARLIYNSNLAGLPNRLTRELFLATGLPPDQRWSTLGRESQSALITQLKKGSFKVTGKSLNKDEFVTCGGIRLSEVNFKTMESKICPGLFFAGELLDIDGITGGFNFQSAWTTGWLAGKAMATEPQPNRQDRKN